MESPHNIPGHTRLPKILFPIVLAIVIIGGLSSYRLLQNSANAGYIPTPPPTVSTAPLTTKYKATLKGPNVIKDPLYLTGKRQASGLNCLYVPPADPSKGYTGLPDCSHGDWVNSPVSVTAAVDIYLYAGDHVNVDVPTAIGLVIRASSTLPDPNKYWVQQ